MELAKLKKEWIKNSNQITEKAVLFDQGVKRNTIYLNYFIEKKDSGDHYISDLFIKVLDQLSENTLFYYKPTFKLSGLEFGYLRPFIDNVARIDTMHLSKKTATTVIKIFAPFNSKGFFIKEYESTDTIDLFWI